MKISIFQQKIDINQNFSIQKTTRKIIIFQCVCVYVCMYVCVGVFNVRKEEKKIQNKSSKKKQDIFIMYCCGM